MDGERTVIPGLDVAADPSRGGARSGTAGARSSSPGGARASGAGRSAGAAGQAGSGGARRGGRAPRNAGPGAVAVAARLPVARIVVDTPLAHLDRPFDYLVPASLADAVVPGSRVRVRFAGRLVDGYVLERVERSEHTGRLAPLARSVSPESVLSEPVARLARAVADRYAGTMADVLRLAIPPRHARAEAPTRPGSTDPEPSHGHPADPVAGEQAAGEPAAAGRVVGDAVVGPDAARGVSSAGPGPEGRGPASGAPAGWSACPDGPAFLSALATGASPRAVWWAPPGPAWPGMIASAVAATVASGRGALVVVPDHRDVDRVAAALAAPGWALIDAPAGSGGGAGSGGRDGSAGRPGAVEAGVPAGVEGPVVLRADLGPAERYRRFLAIRRGQARVVVGTRAAVFAPVADLGLVVVWDDGDDLHSEPRAPYPHTRDVAVLRARDEGCAALIGGFSPSVDADALVRVGWAGRLAPTREALRRAAPRVEAVGSDFEAAIDPAARAARLPSLAVRGARAALAAGAPVLVQVPRRGYHPSVACADCRRPARCRHCSGPLGRAGAASIPACRWCGRPVPLPGGPPARGVPEGAATPVGWRCPTCGGARLRASVTGDRRTAEELGRAFPGVPVRTSGRDGVLAGVPAEPALVIATPGAEPVAAGGYGTVLLLDGWALLGRPDLRAGEETLRRWLAAAALARPASAGGLVVVAADISLRPVQALVRWDPALFVAREADERAEFGFPPASRVAAVEGVPAALDDLLVAAVLPPGAEVLGPVPVPGRPPAVPGESPGLPGARPAGPAGSAGRPGAAGAAFARGAAGGDPEPDPERLIIRVRREQGAELAAALRAARGVLDARRSGRVRVQLDPLTLG